MLIIDTHCHAGGNWFEPIEILEFQMNRCGVNGAILIQHGGSYDNSYLFEEASKRHGRFKVVGLIDPQSPDPEGDLERLVVAGAAGIRLNPDQKFNNTSTIDLWMKAGDLGLVVSVISNTVRLGSTDFKDIIQTCSNTNFVIEHLAFVGMASPPYYEYKSALEIAKYSNTSIKIPGLAEICMRPPVLTSEFKFETIPPLFEMAKEAFGVKRMMWGSDFPPCAGREGYWNTLNGVCNHPAFQNGDDADWVMGKTAARVWGFEENPDLDTSK
ncbi:MAG: hypothetical protein CMM58_01285 [Rhodospirillaceae bacterium]|uniref:Amidohydrolase-related domain-containing protein n=1 Tax=Candidatus Moanibacter tarae TaxID=2200854 RepID=A0A2Z4AC61_9BACT|nr:MAG: hypothetical protein DF168_00852 [Candidatus Moanabacter tarae]MBH66965.1 hypothetical protein [Rhodospirillaceae bacterium]|tara:strand:+ start:7925 stop:8734 length:810 start_codon:yes stop_codon:yes gene_type:complete